MAETIFPKPLDGEVASLTDAITNLTNRFTSSERIGEFTGTTAQTVNLTKKADNFAFLCIRLHDSSGEVRNAVMAPTVMFRNLNYKIFGESSSQWGSVQISSDYTSASCNRTSATTQKIDIFGVCELT